MAKIVRNKPAPTRLQAPQWTQEKRAQFLEELAQTANVVRSARAAGMPDYKAYRERRANPEFRAKWDAALDEGFDKLELLLLERATYGDAVPPEGEAKVGEKQRAIPTALAMSLLKLRESRRAKSPPQRPMRGQKLRDQIEARLAEINRRLGGEG